MHIEQHNCICLRAFHRSASAVSALKCFVGEGNSSIPLPATDVAQEQYEEEQNRESVFEIRYVIALD